MEILNLTPHPIDFLATGEVDSMLTFSPFVGKDDCPRVSRDLENYMDAEIPHEGGHYCVPLVRGTYGEVTNLPEPRWGTYLIVSALVRLACPERKDLISPADVARDENGRVLYCRSFETN